MHLVQGHDREASSGDWVDSRRSQQKGDGCSRGGSTGGTLNKSSKKGFGPPAFEGFSTGAPGCNQGESVIEVDGEKPLKESPVGMHFKEQMIDLGFHAATMPKDTLVEGTSEASAGPGSPPWDLWQYFSEGELWDAMPDQYRD